MWCLGMGVVWEAGLAGSRSRVGRGETRDRGDQREGDLWTWREPGFHLECSAGCDLGGPRTCAQAPSAALGTDCGGRDGSRRPGGGCWDIWVGGDRGWGRVRTVNVMCPRHEGDPVTIPTLHPRQLRLREETSIVSGHTLGAECGTRALATRPSHRISWGEGPGLKHF